MDAAGAVLLVTVFAIFMVLMVAGASVAQYLRERKRGGVA